MSETPEQVTIGMLVRATYGDVGDVTLVHRGVTEIPDALSER